MTVLREIAAQFGIEVDSRGLVHMESQITGALESLEKFGDNLSRGLGIDRINEFVQEMVHAGDELGDVSQRLNISAASLQAWNHAARLNGVDDLTGSLSLLQRNLAGAASGDGAAGAAFRQLGVQVRGADGAVRSMDEILPDIANGIQGMMDPTERAGVAIRLFGRSGAQLVPLLSNGADGVEALGDQFRALGGGATQEFVENASALADAQTRLDVVWFGLRTRIANGLIPIFLLFAEAATSVGGAFVVMADRSHVLEVALIILGGAALGMGLQFLAGFAAPIAIFAVFALAIAFIILLVDDLITLFTGGRSVIGGFIDEMFGAGTAAEVIAELREAWEGLTLAITDAYHAVRQFFGVETPTEPATRTAAQAQESVADAAAREGRVSGQRGQSFEQALASTNETRARLGLAPLGANGEPPAGGASARLPEGRATRTATVTEARRGGASVDARTDVSITIPPGSTREQTEAIRRAVADTLDERNRAAAAALSREAVEE